MHSFTALYIYIIIHSQQKSHRGGNKSKVTWDSGPSEPEPADCHCKEKKDTKVETVNLTLIL